MFTVSDNTGSSPDLSNFLPYYDGVGYDPLNSEFRRRLVQLPISGRFIVSAKDEFRADLMAYNLYGSTSYWWIILDYNGLDSPEQLVVGTKISYPSPKSVSELIYDMSMMSSTSYNEAYDIPEEVSPIVTLKINEKCKNLYFEVSNLRPRYILFNDDRLVDLVTVSLENGNFSVEKYELDGVKVFRVFPTKINRDANKEVLGSVTFTYNSPKGLLNDRCVLQYGGD